MGVGGLPSSFPWLRLFVDSIILGFSVPYLTYLLYRGINEGVLWHRKSLTRNGRGKWQMCARPHFLGVFFSRLRFLIRMGFHVVSYVYCHKLRVLIFLGP